MKTKNIQLKIKFTDVIKYFIEALIVTFGVILGLVLTQHNLQKTTNQNTEAALYQIIEELESNINIFENSLKYHQKISIQIDSLIPTIESNDYGLKYYDNNKFRFNELDGWDGLGTADYKKIIFESAKINGVFQELNIETIKLISEAYFSMNTYEEFKTIYWNKFFDLNSNTTVLDIVQLLFIMKNDITSLEDQTLKILKKSKTELEKTIHNNAFRKQNRK